MNPELFAILLKHLLANLEPNEALHEVVLGGLPDSLTNEQYEECSAILGKMLTTLQGYAINVFREGSQSNN